MKKRTFLLAGAAAAALSAAPAPGRAQLAKRFRVACLWANDPDSIRSLEAAFVTGLRDLGYVDGRNLVLEMRYARGDNSRMPRRRVGIESVGIVMRSKSTRIPVVLIAAPDPVAVGLVRTLGRPGTNVTGMAYRFDELLAKHIELLTEIAPKTSRVALISYAARANELGAAAVARAEQAARTAAHAKRLALTVVSVRDSQTVRQAFAELERARPDAIVVVATAATYRLRDDITREARRLRLPSITSLPAEWAEAGGLMTYGPDWQKTYRYAATFVHRILQGANPAEMPIEQPTFEVVINMKTAREIGVNIPQSILVRADRVID